MKNFGLSARFIAISILLAAALAIAAPAQTFTKLADLSMATGESPSSPLTQGLDGNFYGTAYSYGAFRGGTFIKVTPSGVVTDLYDFCFNDNESCPDGAGPSGAVALGTDGNFYGTTIGSFTGGEESTIFQITPLGSLTTLHTFCSSTGCPDGAYATGSGLTLARNGDFYGTSFPQDGSSAFDNVVFKISPSGSFTTLLTVCPDTLCPTDAGPFGLLLQSSAGALIGPGPGGASGMGAFYRMTAAGTPTVFFSMCDDSVCHDGGNGGTTSPFVQSSSAEFFGTDFYGGAGANCTLSQGCGTVFRVTSAGTFNKVHDFCSSASCADGSTPNALIQATDGNLYGTALQGGAHGGGVVFRLTQTGHFSVVHSFSNVDGTSPRTALLQGTDGNLYGTTGHEGINDGGTIFRISLGLAPFVKTVQNSGNVGASVIVLGNNLTGSTSVTFNGTAAAFTVVSATEITATVPTGAATGTIRVVTPSTTLSSNVAFQVLP